MASTVARPAGSSSSASSPAALSRGRRAVVWTLVCCGTLLALVAILTTWVDRQLLDNHAWERASTQVVQNSEIRAALSGYLVNQVYTNVDVAKALEAQLPANLKHLSVPLANGLRGPAETTAAFILARPRVQQLFVASTTLAHQKLVNVLENKTGYGISTGNGVVTIDLHAFVVELGSDLGLPASALDKLPNRAGVVTVIRSDQLTAAQQGVRAVKVLSGWLLVIVLAIFALAVYLARGIRRETLRNIGWGLVLVGLVVLIVRRVLGNYAIDALASPSYHGSVHAAWLIGTSILGQIAAAAILYGLIAVGAAALAGPAGWATAARRAAAPTLNHRPGIVAAGAATLFLLLVLWGPTHALRQWWGLLLFAALLAAGVAALRAQTRAEFPDEPRIEAADTRTPSQVAAGRRAAR